MAAEDEERGGDVWVYDLGDKVLLFDMHREHYEGFTEGQRDSA